MRYTNHRLRVTSMQVMEDAGIESRDIQRVSGHKSLDSVSNYARRLSKAKKRNISRVLSEATNIVADRQPPACPKYPRTAGSTFAQNNISSPVEHVNGQQNVVVEQRQVQEMQINDFASTEMNDPIDTLMANIPPAYLNGFRGLPRLFAPVMNQCSNVTFNVNIFPQASASDKTQ